MQFGPPMLCRCDPLFPYGVIVWNNDMMYGQMGEQKMKYNLPKKVWGWLASMFGLVFAAGYAGSGFLKMAVSMQWRVFGACCAAGILCRTLLKGIQWIWRTAHHDLISDVELDDWNVYPRPQMKRDSFYSLNGIWELNGTPVRVPFPPQAQLSGYKGQIHKHMIYRKCFSLPEDFCKGRVLLHFGAVDQIAEVYLNGCFVCRHEGGYLPFSADITEFLKLDKQNPAQETELVVKMEDGLSDFYPYGKQCKKRGGMWYTPVSGIWQTVWLESVPDLHIERIKMTPLSTQTIAFALTPSQPLKKGQSYRIILNLNRDGVYSFSSTRNYFELDLSDIVLENGRRHIPQAWTPEHPYLYHVSVRLEEDEIATYFALRTVEIRTIQGRKRICLNGKPIFLHGVLDQGYFCDGLFLPASPTGYEQDIQKMKELGFNTLRKHIKVEPECFYEACDRLGMLVMQDMVNSGYYSFVRDTVCPTFGGKFRRDTGLRLSPHMLREKRRRKFFIQHAKETMEYVYNHPSVVAYTIFNEGWGQFHSDAVGRELRKTDNTRIMDLTSGWFTQKESDVDSQHIYYFVRKPILPKETEERKPILVSECGGYSYLVEGHTYSRYNKYGYGDMESMEKLTQQLEEMYHKMIIEMIPEGVCGCFYTQLSDVEDETNGLYTYDRKVCKVQKETIWRIAEKIWSKMDECV